jgi:hypothetical protein
LMFGGNWIHGFITSGNDLFLECQLFGNCSYTSLD